MAHLTLLFLIVIHLFGHEASQIRLSQTKYTTPTVTATAPDANALIEHVRNSETQLIKSTPTTLKSLLRKANTPQLTRSEKQTIITAVKTVVPSLSVNRFLQLNFYNVDIHSHLASLSEQVESPHNANQSNIDFHTAMLAIFARLRDRHTTYILPEPLQSAFAVLDFTVKTFFTDDERQKGTLHRRYVALDIPLRLSRENDGFVDGVELVSWNGTPISRFINNLGRDSYGSNKAAQLSNALVSLTFRGLGIDPVPLEPFATIGFIDRGGRKQVALVPWLFFEERMVGSDDISRHMSSSRLPSTRESVAKPAGKRPPRHTRKGIAVKKVAVGLFQAEVIFSPLGKVGRLILPSFNANTTKELVEEMSRVLRLMPEEGLILDIRDNFGGQVDFAKSWIELLTNATIAPQPQTVRASRLMTQLVKQDAGKSSSLRRFLGAFGPAVQTAAAVGEMFSGPVDGLFLTGDVPKRLNQVYRGPLVTIMNGLTYSAGDVFAAFQVEKRLSLLVGTSDRTGAGGASTVRYSALVDTYPHLFKDLPGGIDFTCSYTRHFRSGSRQGALMEFFGVVPDERYYSTLNDALFDEEDFVDFLVAKLKEVNGK